MTTIIGIDHIYLTVSDPPESERFYDRVLLDVLGFKKNCFALGSEPHIQYFNRHFGLVLRPARGPSKYDRYATGLHHLCLRVDSVAEVHDVSARLRSLGIDASPATQYPDYAEDYVATFFDDPDGIHLEVTNYRKERRLRHDQWQEQQVKAACSE